ncbi:MAG: EthD family reductase [Streptosporangiaceae bacterium]|nr:EthD family reductase [Streptosporangiaceae bacterium]
MVRFLVLYQQPTDAEAFDKHYSEVHVPLVKQLPGLRRYTVSRNTARVRGPDPYYLVAELDWDDMDSLRRDFSSPAGQETARDVEKLAEWCPAIHSMIFELEDV